MRSIKSCRGIAALALFLIPLLAAGCVTWFSNGDGVIEDQFPEITNPTASTTTPAMGEAVTLGVTATDPQGQTLTYEWSDGGAGGVFTGTGANVTWSCDTPGTYTVSVTVTDSDGNETVETFTIVVQGEVGPTWELTGLNASNITPDVGADVTLTAAVSNPDGVALTYTWSGGGTFVGTGNSVTWSSDAAGEFTLTVTVSDGDNDASLNVGVTVSEVVIPNEAPVFMNYDVDPAVPYELHGDVNAPVATQRIRYHGIKATDPDGDAVTYEWTASGAGEFTDVTVDVDGFAEAYWAADAAGNYVITLTADDGKGGVSMVSAVAALNSDGFDVGPLPTDFDYVGFEGCNLCHPDTVTGWEGTAHADGLANTGALDPANGHGFRNSSCYGCHAVGYTPVGEGGFIDPWVTPQFANIQCESCHGGGNPAGMGSGHKPNPMNPGLGYVLDGDGFPVLTDEELVYDEAYDGAMGYGCGVCHEGSRHGAYESWLESKHAVARVWEDDGSGGLAPAHERTGASCNYCHNGYEYVRVTIRGEAAEEILEEDYDPNMAMIGCATCHDPHSNQYEAQLRWDSAADTVIPFDDVPVNAGRGTLCITCHNGRRTRANYDGHITSGSGHFGPHGNPQGPVLFGLMGADLGAPANYDGDHAHESMTQNGCVSCHMYRHDYVSSSEPALWGHEMEPKIEACAVCHVGETDMEALIGDLQAEVQGLLDDFVAAWPAAWKDVSDPANPVLENRDTDPPTGVGPARDDPTGNAYREALWNYYLVVDDLSMGVHNPRFVRDLLEQSIARVEELNAL